MDNKIKHDIVANAFADMMLYAKENQLGKIKISYFDNDKKLSRTVVVDENGFH